MFNAFIDINAIRARAHENNPVFHLGTKIVPLENGLFQILTSDGRVIYEGEMQDGKKHGFGIEYFDYEKGYVKYIGNYKNDTRNGYGQRYVLRDGKPVLIEDGIFEDWYFKQGKQYLEGQLEYDGEVETIGNLVIMDQKKNDYDNYDYYKSKSNNLEYLYHGKGSKYTPGESKPNFIGEFDRGEPTVGKVFYDSSAFTKDKLRQLPSYKQSNKPLHEKEQDIQNTENKYKNHHIQMGEKKMNIKKDNYGNQKVEHFVEVNKNFGDTKSKYKLRKEYNKMFEDEIKYNDDCNNLNEKQYLLSKHLQGTWNNLHRQNILFQEKDKGTIKSVKLTEQMAQDIAKYM